jgi:hypothetical protein
MGYLNQNRMKTAVEWLIEQCPRIETIVAYNILEQAKEMEKEQIVNAFEIGYDNGACVQEGNAIYHGSNYYNETFKSE